jgi:hypothetical protein
LEPSLAHADGRFLLAIRAEDGHGHVASSSDGLSWSGTAPWRWDDGDPIEMSSTQQHWLTVGGRLHLVYTRRTPENERVLRWRSPLFIAAVDLDRLCLDRASERVVFPIVGEGERVAGLGNFHPLAYAADEGWVSVSEETARRTGHGDTWLARIRVESSGR